MRIGISGRRQMSKPLESSATRSPSWSGSFRLNPVNMIERNLTEAYTVQFPLILHAAEIGWTPLPPLKNPSSSVELAKAP